MNYFADIHCHPTLHPYANKASGKIYATSPWHRDAPKNRQRDNKYPEFSQSDFSSLASGNVKLVYASMYPLEQGWFDVSLLGESLLTDLAANFITRIPLRYINTVQKGNFSYFEALKNEYELLKSEQGKKHKVNGSEYSYKLLANAEQLSSVLKEDKTIAVIPSIEGVQSLISGSEEQINRASFDYDETLRNVEAVRSWESPPFYITFAHHFYNGYCGHSRSIYPPVDRLINQNVGINAPLNSRGEELIDCLLGLNDFKGNGRRILIDTKHMSVAARLMYYQKIKSHNLSKNDEDKIPVIASHTAYSGHATLQASILQPDSEDDKYKSARLFNNWSINLSDDEIVHIFHSNGLIGLILDERILSSYKRIEDYREEITKRDIKRNSIKVREFWSRQILKNIFAIVNAVYSSTHIKNAHKEKIWNMISLGSDFDGMINPVDAYITAEEFSLLEHDLLILMSQTRSFNHHSSLQPEDILRKIMYQNAVDFAEMYYH